MPAPLPEIPWRIQGSKVRYFNHIFIFCFYFIFCFNVIIYQSKNNIIIYYSTKFLDFLFLFYKYNKTVLQLHMAELISHDQISLLKKKVYSQNKMIFFFYSIKTNWIYSLISIFKELIKNQCCHLFQVNLKMMF